MFNILWIYNCRRGSYSFCFCFFRYVWIVPVYTEDVSNAVTGFDVVIQSQQNPDLDDLAKGAGGDYRYLLTRIDAEEDRKVTQLILFRSDSALDGVPIGWDGITADINKGRGKTYLYLVWKNI